mgnify:CR=1 FL=1
MGRHRTSQGTGPPRKPAYYVVRYLSYPVNLNLSSVYFLLNREPVNLPREL